MADSDLDSVSTYSTVPSEDGKLYNVENILAEKDEGRGLEYLVEWEGYPLEEATWQTEEDFMMRDCIETWEERKSRIENGLEDPFDLEEYERKLTQVKEETQRRKARREKKRARLGLFRDPRTGERIQEQALISSDEQDEGTSVRRTSLGVNETPCSLPIRRTQPTQEASREEPEESDDLPSFRKHAKKARTASQSDVPMKDVTDGNSSKDPRRRSFAASSTRTGTVAKADSMSGSKPAVRAPKSMNSGSKTKNPPRTKPSTSKGTVLNPTKASLKTGRSQLVGSNIFKAPVPEPPKQRKKSSGDSMAKRKEGPPKQFKRLSIQNRAQKVARREPAPNIEDLKFVDLANGKVIGKDNVREQQKTPYQLIQEELANKRSQEVKDSTGSGPHARSPTPMDPMDIDQNEVPLFVEDTHSKQAQPSEAQETAVPASDSNQTIVTEPDDRVRFLVEDQVQSPMEDNAMDHATPEQNEQNHAGEAIGDSLASSNDHTAADSREALPEKRKSLTLPETRLELGQRDTSLHQQNTQVTAPVDENQYQQSRIWEMQPITDNTDRPHLPYDLEGTLRNLPIQELIGDRGMGAPNKKAKSIGKGDISDIYGEILFDGVDKDKQRATFRGLTSRAIALFMTLKKAGRVDVMVHEFLTFAEYSERYHTTKTRYFGAGHILPGPRGTGVSVGKLTDQLNSLRKGGMFFAEYLILIIYPPGLKDWDSVNRLYPSASPHCLLRFLVREAETLRYKEIHFPPNSKNHSFADPPASVKESSLPLLNHPSHHLQPEPTHDPRLQHSKGSSNPHLLTSKTIPQDSAPQVFQNEEKSLHVSAQQLLDQETVQQPINFDELFQAIMATDQETVMKLFKDQLNFDWKAMVPHSDMLKDKRVEVTVFVQYPSQLEKERELLNSFLQKMIVKRYDSGQRGDWRAFSENRRAGVILLHESQRDLSSLPRLGRVLREPGINVLRINFGSPYSVVDGQPLVTPNPGYVRLFPSGSEVLLTDSVFFQSPRNIIRLLRWFRHCIFKYKPPFTWQIFTRPKLLTWINDLFVSLELGATKEARHYLDIIREFNKLIEPRHMEPDGLTPTPKAPYYSAFAIAGYDLNSGLGSKKADQQTREVNEDKLVNWFGEISLQHIESRRRFSVLYDGPQEVTEGWKAKWTHLKFFSSEEYVKREIVPWEMEQKKREEKKQAASGTSPPTDATGTSSREAGG